MQSLEQSRSGRLVGPKNLAIGAAVVVLVVLLTVVGEPIRNLLMLALAGTAYFAYRKFAKK